MQKWWILVLVCILFFIETATRFVIAYQKPKKQHFMIWVVYFGLSILPMCAFLFRELYLPMFYVFLFVRNYVQEELIPLNRAYINRCLHVQFVVFASIHLCAIGLTSVLTYHTLHDVLASPILLLNATIITLLIYCSFKLTSTFFKRDRGIIIKKEQYTEFRYFFYFLNLSVIYIFIQSIVCVFHVYLQTDLAFFLCGNCIAVVLVYVYLDSLYKIFCSAHIEQYHNALCTSLSEMDLHIHTLRNSVHFDGLTQARSRLFLIQEGSRLLDTQTPFSLVYMDLNGLKYINDTQGHQAGDLYLYEFVQAMKQHIREEDTLARFGGDEFVLLLVDCSKDTAKKRLIQIRQELQNFSFAAGIVDTTEATTLDVLVCIADKRMYADKRKGRINSA